MKVAALLVISFALFAIANTHENSASMKQTKLPGINNENMEAVRNTRGATESLEPEQTADRRKGGKKGRGQQQGWGPPPHHGWAPQPQVIPIPVPIPIPQPSSPYPVPYPVQVPSYSAPSYSAPSYSAPSYSSYSSPSSYSAPSSYSNSYSPPSYSAQKGLY
ncbi:unnamed protein product [Orchesella dallaii]|uniref:Uncharacterized protein n=1 Tax=Orchesella dallaii TaxID=48710 RepID=A0ABP1QA45_9HEXA